MRLIIYHELMKKLLKNNDYAHNKAKKALIVFFLMMFILTILSRAADSITVPKVKVCNVKSGTLKFIVKGEGVIMADSEEYVSVLSGARVKKIFHYDGSYISSGDKLFQFDISDLNKQYINKKDDYDKALIEINKLKLNNSLKDYKSDNYKQKVDNMRNKLDVNKAEQDVEIAKDNYKRAYEFQERKDNINKNNTKDEKQDELDKAEENLADVKLANKIAVKKAQRAIEDAKHNLKVIEEDDDDKYSDLDKKNAKHNITRAEEDLKNVKKQCDLDLQRAENAVERAQNHVDNSGNEPFDYESSLSDKQSAVDDAFKNEKDALDKAEDSQIDYDDKIKADNVDKANEEVKKAITKGDIDEALIELNSMKRELDTLYQIINSNGIVYSKNTGVVSRMEVEEGKYTAGTEAVAVNLNQCVFKAKVSAQCVKPIEKGDEAELKINDNEKAVKVKINNISLPDNENMVTITCALPVDKNFQIGKNIAFTINKNSRVYEKYIPMEAVRNDERGKYILVVRNKETALGKEQVTRRVNISIIDKNHENAAVTSDVTSDDKIIKESSRNIEEGNRVRVDNDDDVQ